ncbi:MAG TPA: hypothetical protein VHU85_17785 [Acidimicrobiales bacterium]|jgi:ppGpp synthetase/RelA/SpoT-type nucleotidyltranferase|nr:hypothetical protein [Acidimicrobiales bacterium]
MTDVGDTETVATAGSEPRPTEVQYPGWFESKFGIPIVDDTEQQYYKNTVKELVTEFSDSRFWKKFVELLRDADEQELISHDYRLLAKPVAQLDVLPKPWESLVEKTFRRNVLNNPNWESGPEAQPPPKGWVTPDNWFTLIPDLVRTTVVVRYIDGVEIVRGLINQAAHDVGIASVEISWEARDVGYYALHANIPVPLSRTTKGWKRLEETILIEIQVCTQVQDVIRSLTHTIYETARRLPKDQDTAWQWQYKDVDFTPKYLGHILHYADGMIVNIRDRKKEPEQ